MRGDFSRIRFNRRRNYTAVLEQQGRVALDADANEQCFIDACQTRTETIDAVGQCGGPVADAGFQITVAGNEIGIGPGRYYVNGLLCDNPTSLSYEEQPYLSLPGTAPDAAVLLSGLNVAAGALVIQVWLQVWQRLQTALDDPCLLEPALGQADTTARVQTVWRAVASLVPAPQPPAEGTGPAPSCCQDMNAAAPPQPSTGTMTAGTSGPAADCGCGPVAAAGYQGIENQLYRVEIQAGRTDADATFKWSRENGSVVTAITAISGSTVTVSSLGPDANLGFQTGQWVELTDDTLQFALTPNSPGTLYQIQSIQQKELSVTLAGQAGQTISVDPSQNARMRRWDQSGPAATATGIPLSAGTWIQLENGIQVSFATGTYNSGDYWTIPARAATGQIEWPPCGSDGNPAQPPACVQVYNAPLACVHWVPPTSDAAAGVLVEDCRQTFSPLTAIAPPTTVEAIHVTGVSWVNDDITTLDQLLANGLVIDLDQTPSSPVTGANFIVTVETPAAPPNDDSLTLVPGTAAVARNAWVLDAPISVGAQAISWLLPREGVNLWQGIDIAVFQMFLNSLLSPGAPSQLFARVRVRLPGQMIFASGPIYLDGQTYGQAALRQDGVTPRIDLRLPSGNEAVSSDFDGWFYLAPTLAVTSLSFNFGPPPNQTVPGLTVVVDFLNRVTGVEATVNNAPQAVNPVVTIALSYPAVAPATVALALTGTTGVGTVATIPASVSVPVGQASVSFPITVLTNPGQGNMYTFNITATLSAAALLGSSQAASFTVTGVAPPVLTIGHEPVVS